MADRLGETTQDQQRELLSAIETSVGYQPPAMATGYSPVVEVQKQEQLVSPAVKSKPGTDLLNSLVRLDNRDIS